MSEFPESVLLSPTELRGGLTVANRIVMAPMTRARASEPSGEPSDFAPEYYAQRASAGLLITEATNISLQGKGYSQTPGIYTDAQVVAWRRVTTAVHALGGRVFLQIWHVGRIAARETCGGDPVAPSPQTAPGSVWVAREDGWTGMVPCDPARALTVSEIADVVEDFASAAENAIAAGFDGVELHGANGYLIDQFLRTTTNHRTDEYGGDASGRVRFLREVVQAVVARIGPSRVGVRLSPVVGFSDAQDPEIFATTVRAAALLEDAGVAYLHLAEGDSSWEGLDGVDADFRAALRRVFRGTIIVAHQYDAPRGAAMIDEGLADLVAFGRPFIANPDLVERIRLDAPLAESEKDVWYGGGAAGYVDYPLLSRLGGS